MLYIHTRNMHVLIYKLAQKCFKTTLPPYTSAVIAWQTWLSHNKIVPHVSNEMMQSCETYLVWWCMMLFLLLLIVPWISNKEEDGDERKVRLLDLMRLLSLCLVGGILYHFLLDYLVALYQTNQDNVTFWDVGRYWCNKVINGEIIVTILYYNGKHEYGTVKQEPIVLFLFLGIVLVMVSWFVLFLKMEGRLSNVFCTVGVLLIGSWCIMHPNVLLVVLSMFIPIFEWFFDPLTEGVCKLMNNAAT